MRRATALLLLAGVAAAQDLGRAKQLLHGIAESQVREGAEICARAGSVEGVELLLDVLDRTTRLAGRGLAPAHYRDIVWDYLASASVPEVRDRVERELRTNRKNEYVREWCAQLLGIYGEERFGPSLVKALSDKHKGTQRAAAQALGRLRFAPATSTLERLARSKDVYVRGNAIEALARIDPEKQKQRFLHALKEDPDGGVRCALLGAVPEIYLDLTESLATEALDDADWRPRLQAVDTLDGRRAKTAVDGLVRAVADGRPVVSFRAVQALQRLTGKEIYDADAWRGWWGANRESFQFPEEKKPEDGKEKGKDEKGKEKGEDEQKEPGKEAPKDAAGDGAPPGERRSVYNGIPLVSDHVAFLIDKSVWMRQQLESKKTSKDQAAFEELQRVLGELHGRLSFNVFCYREDVEKFQKNAVALDEKSQKKALTFVSRQVTKDAKDIWQVLELVLADPEIDTAYLLSSGEPDTGLYVHWNRVTDHLKDRNRFRKLTVHTVVYSERQWFRDQLEKIAEATGGKFQWFK